MINDDRFFTIGDLTLDGKPDITVPVLSNNVRVKTQRIMNQFPNIFPHSSVDGVGGFFDASASGGLGILTNNGIFQTALSNSNFYLKVSVLNGHCLDGCQGERYPNPPPFATTLSNSLISIKFTTRQGSSHSLIGSHQFTSGLSLPFWFFGLTNNAHYVQQMVIHNPTPNEFTWLYPNSHIFVYEKFYVSF
jgi:hypothetical protein